MNKYLLFHINDLLTDSEAVAKAIQASCIRNSSYSIQCSCQFGQDFIVILTPDTESRRAVEVRWLEQRTRNMEDAVAMMQTRWQAGYDVCGSVTTEEGRLFLLVQRRLENTLKENKS